MNKREWKDVLNISIPVMGETILYTVISMFDILLIGKFQGKDAVSAAGISNEILFTFCNIFITAGIGTAITSLTARNIGSKNPKSAEQYATLGSAVGFFIALVLTFAFFNCSKYILLFAGVKKDILPLSIAYLKMCSIAVFLYMLSCILSSILRGYGNTYIPFLAASITVLLNLVFDILFILGKAGFPTYGIQGAAIAKILAQGTGFLFLWCYFLLKSKIKIRIHYLFLINSKKTKDFFALFIPSSLEEAAIRISQLFTNFIILHCSTAAYAANQIANTIEAISYMPSVGIGIAATTLVGLKFGEKNYKKTKDYAKICGFLGIAIALLCSIVFFLMPNFLVQFFMKENESEIIFLGSQCLKIGSIEQPFLAIAFIFTGALKGMGDAKTPLYISIITSWFVRLPLIFYFIYILKFSITYVWWITALQWFCDATLTHIFFKKTLSKRTGLLRL